MVVGEEKAPNHENQEVPKGGIVNFEQEDLIDDDAIEERLTQWQEQNIEMVGDEASETSAETPREPMDDGNSSKIHIKKMEISHISGLKLLYLAAHYVEKGFINAADLL
ncbi:unnamed protein product [Hermetia illucens]|uniref:Uncharacterized protein n=1 Tax=Hermetia illucens TaxID=343691 RepID=A0A7R8V4E2_HERIL|nr:unnamed protein product [Hermetia illucens]